MKTNIITLGCSKNTVDSENVAGHLAHAGFQVHFDRSGNDCDIVIVNTCGFIGDAKEESINVLIEQIEAKRRFNRRHARDGRHRTLIAVGCLVERYRDELRPEMPEVDAWYGVHEWESLIESFKLRTVSCKWSASHSSPMRVVSSGDHEGDEAKSPRNRQLLSSEPSSCFPELRSATLWSQGRRSVSLTTQRTLSTPKHYAYLKISEGCNRACSYCAIPLIRGKHVSRPIDDLVAEARQLVADGVKELILIAQDTTYYGLDLYGRRALADLLERLATESGASWIRLHYTYPTSFPVDAIEVMRRHDNICNYIDIPLQHINTRILSSMQRGIDREGTLALLRQFREQLPDVAIRTTLIVGYPGETEKEFDELKAFVREARFDRMGCFAYSPEEGTPAERLGDPVAEEEKSRRVGELMVIQERISLEKNEARVGRVYRVLVDRREGDYYIARTEFDSPEVDDEVLIAAKRPLRVGDFCNVRITGALENDLLADLL